MGGMGERGETMYSYVPKAVVKPKRSICLQAMTEAKAILSQRYDLNTRIVPVGSGSNFLVTKWDNGPFDVDFNLLFSNIPEEYLEHPKKLKDTLRLVLDEVLIKYGFSHGQDSTSVISYTHKKNRRPYFALDIGIILRGGNGNLNRLIHQKSDPERFLWNESKNSSDVMKRAVRIKQAGQWNTLRKVYLNLKNQYGRDADQPSFIVYVEAVNLVWQSIPDKE